MDDPVLRITTLLVAAASAVTAVGVLVQKWLRPMMRGIIALGRKAHALDGLSDIAPAVARVAAQFEPNGGESLIDRVSAVEARLEQSGIDNTARFHALRSAQQDIGGRLERMETKIGVE